MLLALGRAAQDDFVETGLAAASAASAVGGGAGTAAAEEAESRWRSLRKAKGAGKRQELIRRLRQQPAHSAPSAPRPRPALPHRAPALHPAAAIRCRAAAAAVGGCGTTLQPFRGR